MKSRALLPALLLLLSIGTPACIHVTGQRITLVRDGGDLVLLTHHDGIYTTEGGGRSDVVGNEPDAAYDPALAPATPSSDRKFEEYVRNGNICFLGWLLQIDMEELRATAEGRDEADVPVMREFASAFVNSVSSEIVGRYDDTDGRTGWLQIVRIRDPEKLFDRLNRCINAGMAKADSKEEGAVVLEHEEEFPRTAARIRQAVAEGWEWVRLEGHAISIRCPVDGREWMVMKRKGLHEICDDLIKRIGEKKGDDDGESAAAIDLMAIAPLTSFLSTSFSLAERGGTVTFTVGDPTRPNTLRLRFFDAEKDYMPNMKDVVARCIPAGLDEEIARALIEGTRPGAKSALAVLLDHGPPEAQVRALLNVALAGGETSGAAFETLLRWGETWNGKGERPAAPLPADDRGETLERWKDWHRAMILFPMES